VKAWFCIPSKRPLLEAENSLSKWREMGYGVALWRDEGDTPHPPCDFLHVAPKYLGWGTAINYLGRQVLSMDAECDWIVCGGDDTLPDAQRTPDQIAFECGRHFGENQQRFRLEPTTISTGYGHEPCQGRSPWSTFGVMQPLGDLELWPNSQIDKICGSPWIGREYFLRAYQGNGPICAEYGWMYDDEEMYEVTKRLGVLWQRHDVTHIHNHWARNPGGQCPTFAQHANTPQHFQKNKHLFESRKRAGFPGSKPLQMEVGVCT
jgi:hypothetical protein